MNLLSKSSLSLMNKILLAFVGYVFIVLLMFSIIVVTIDRGKVRRISDGYTDSILEDRSRTVERWLEERLKDIEVLALTEELRSMTKEKYLPLLRDAMGHHSDIYLRYYTIDLNGNMTDTLGIETTVGDRYDFTADSRGAIITAPKIDMTFKQPTIEVMVPIIQDSQVVGMLGATARLNNLNDEVSRNPVYGNGYTWVVSADGQVVSHVNSDIVGTSILSSDGTVGLFEQIQSKVESGKNSIDFISSNGEKEYHKFKKANGDQAWYVIVSLYQSDIYRTVIELITSMALLVLIVMVLSVAVSWFLAKDITGPIQTLIEVTTKFTTGVKGVRAEVASKDEIGILAQSFNNMADTIVAHTDNLEEMIKERTSVLADLNYQIISRNKELGTMNEELEKTNNRLHELASKDMLTGLQNRHQFQRELQNTMELVNAGREENFSLLFIDLDNFKYYNDAFSHEIGDYLLQEIAGILRGKVRGNDVVGRYGGDEFVILLREGSYEIATTIAQRIHKAILDRDGFKEDLRKKLGAEVKIMGKNKLSSSIGIVKYMRSMDMTNAEELLAKADETMYKAKKQGKSRVVVG